MINKKLILVTILAIGFLTSNAQGDKSKNILDGVSAKTKSYSTIKADFTWTIIRKDKSEDTQKGQIKLKGEKYTLNIPGHKIYCDGTTLWDYILDMDEVIVKDVEIEEGGLNPTNIFTIYEDGFKYKFESENATTQTINLYPLNPDKVKFHTVKLIIDKKGKQISVVKMMMKNGTAQIYTVTSFEGNLTMPDSDFQFNSKKYPDVIVEDLR